MRLCRKKVTIIVKATINDELYDYLIQLLEQKFYSTTDLEELTKINGLFGALKHQTEPWLSEIRPKKQ